MSGKARAAPFPVTEDWVAAQIRRYEAAPPGMDQELDRLFVFENVLRTIALNPAPKDAFPRALARAALGIKEQP